MIPEIRCRPTPVLRLLARPRLHHRFDSEVIERFVQPRMGLAVDVLHHCAHELFARHIGGRALSRKSFKQCSNLAKAHPLHEQRRIVAGEEIPTSSHHTCGGVKVGRCQGRAGRENIDR